MTHRISLNSPRQSRSPRRFRAIAKIPASFQQHGLTEKEKKWNKMRKAILDHLPKISKTVAVQRLPAIPHLQTSKDLENIVKKKKRDEMLKKIGKTALKAGLSIINPIPLAVFANNRRNRKCV